MGNKLSRKNTKSLRSSYSKNISTPLPETIEAIRSPILAEIENAIENAKLCTNSYDAIMNLYTASKELVTPSQKRFLDDFMNIYTEPITPEDYVKALYTSSSFSHSSGKQHPTLPYLQNLITNSSVDVELKSYRTLPSYISKFKTDITFLKKTKQTLTEVINIINTINELPDPTPDDIQHIVVRQIVQDTSYSYAQVLKHLELLEIATYPTKQKAKLVVNILKKVYLEEDIEYSIIPITKTTKGFFTLFNKTAPNITNTTTD